MVRLNRIYCVSIMFTGLREHLWKTLFLARAALGTVHQGMFPVLCICSSNSAGVSILEWINKGEGWPYLELERDWCDVNTLDGCSEGCSFEQNSFNISPHWVSFLCWANCMKLVWETPKICLWQASHFYFQAAQWENLFKFALKRKDKALSFHCYLT